MTKGDCHLVTSGSHLKGLEGVIYLEALAATWTLANKSLEEIYAGESVYFFKPTGSVV